MLSQKEVQILKILYENRHSYTTSQELSAKLVISDRTARKYLHIVADAVQTQQSEIEAIRGQGYRLIIKDEAVFEHFYQQEVHAITSGKELTSIHESKDRQYYVLHQLFFEGNKVFVDDIARELFVSRSTISNDLAQIKKVLSPYSIELKSKPSIGIYVGGSEQSFRHFIMNYFFMTRLHDNLYTFSMYSNLLDKISIEEIVIIVLDECREAHLQISDFIIFNIVLHIGLSIKRIQRGYEIEQETVVDIPPESVEYQTSLRIIKRLSASIEMRFPIEEAAYIAMHLQNKTTSKLVFKRIPYDRSQLKEQVIAVLGGIDLETGYALARDTILIDGLMMHFIPLLLRLQNNSSIGNPLIEQIKEQYSELLRLTVKHFEKMPVFHPFSVTESEWAYLTIHLTAAVERYFNNQKARVLVICATGLGSSQMLKARLEHELGSKMLIEQVISYYEISEQGLEDIDLIISSIGLPHVLHNTPIVHVSVFLDKADIAAINYELSRYKGSAQLGAPRAHPDGQDGQPLGLIQACFKPELFVYRNTPATKESVIAELLRAVEQVEGRPITEALTKQLQLRETYGSVAFSDYLAVPHPIEPITRSAYAAVAIVPEGIFWDEAHPHIQLVFLLSPDSLNLTPLEKISLMLVPIIEKDQVRQHLANCRTFETFIDAFTTYL